MTVHFICRGNAHRSIMAEAYLKSLQLENVEVLSSGTVADNYRLQNEPIISGIRKRLEKHGTGIYAKTISEQLTQNRVDSGDITVCVNQIVANECESVVSMPNNTIVWDVSDTGEGNRIILPGEDKYKYFEEVYEEITKNVDELITEKILALV